MPKAVGCAGAVTRGNIDNEAGLDTQLHIAALRGDRRFLANTESKIINRAITDQGETALHIAALAGHVEVVEDLLRKLNEKDLERVNHMGCNALCYAAVSGNLKIVEQMVEAGSKSLLNPRTGAKPLMMAASLEHREVVRYLFDKTNVHDWPQDQQADLFTTCTSIGLYDIALKMLDKYNPKLATAQNKYGESALLVLARIPSTTFAGESQPGLLKRLVNSRKGLKLRHSRNSNKSPAFRLLDKLCIHALKSDEESQIPSTGEVAKVLLEAASVGNLNLLIKLIQHNPDLIWVKDNQGGSIFHVAVENRHETIFSLLSQLGAIKDLIANRVTKGENNLLHLAARLAPQDKLTTVSGAALQLHRELLWFKEVEKMVPNAYREMKNSDGYTPKSLFTETHKRLRKEGERWIKESAGASLLVATLIAVVFFHSAPFSLSGGSFYSSGRLVLMSQNLSAVLSISYAVGLCASLTSMLMFLSTLNSRYAERDFLVSVPFKLLMGFTSLFISVTAMAVASSTSFHSNYGQRCFPFIFVLGLVPVLYLFLTCPLLVDLLQSMRGSRFLFRPRKRLFL